MAKTNEEIIAAFVMDFRRRKDSAWRDRLLAVGQRVIRRLDADMQQIAGRYGLQSAMEMQRLHADGRFQDGQGRRDLRRLEAMQDRVDSVTAFLESLQDAATTPGA